jgi:hypothetical protein
VASAPPADSGVSIGPPSAAPGRSQAATPATSTRNSGLFPPRTGEVQFDEKWSFGSQKQKQCDPLDPADACRGDCWDHVAWNPEPRRVVSVVVGKRTTEETQEEVADFSRRTEGRPMHLSTTDESIASEGAILRASGRTVTPPRTGRPGHPRQPYRVPPERLISAPVDQRRVRGRVVEIVCRVIFGTRAAVLAALGRTRVSRALNTAFVARPNARDRHRNARKGRRTDCFSQDWEVHREMSYLMIYITNILI